MVNYIAGVVMVVRQGGTPRDALDEALNAIDFADGHVLGIILTRVDMKSGKGGYKYKNGYKYKYKYKDYSYGYGNNTGRQKSSDSK